LKDMQIPKMAQGNQIPPGVYLTQIKEAKEHKNYHISVATLIMTSIGAAASVIAAIAALVLLFR